MDEFSYSLLNPLKSNIELRNAFGDSLDYVMDDAVKMEQKKVRNPGGGGVGVIPEKLGGGVRPASQNP